MVRWLVEEKHANINLQSKDGFTAIMCASKSGKFDICKYLLEKGADIFVVNSVSETATSYALSNGLREIVALYACAGGPMEVEGRSKIGVRNTTPLTTMFQLGGQFIGKHES